MDACSPTSSSSEISSPSIHSSNQSGQSTSAFSAFQPFLMQQQLLALLSAQLQSALPVPSATANNDKLEVKSEPMEQTILEPMTVIAPPHQNSLLTTVQNLSIPTTHNVLGLKKEELLRIPSESPSSTVSSPRKRSADHMLDKTSEDYLERRRKNNDSARRSREVRRLREQSNRERMQVLEVENGQLRSQISSLRMELSQLQLVLLSGGINIPNIPSQANSDSSTSPSVSE